MVVKERPDGTKKYRISLDLRQNRVNILVDQGERVVLPRRWEAIGVALDLAAACEHGSPGWPLTSAMLSATSV